MKTKNAMPPEERAHAAARFVETRLNHDALIERDARRKERQRLKMRRYRANLKARKA